MLSLPTKDLLQMKKEIVIEKLKSQECVICMEELNFEPAQEDKIVLGYAFKTPCKHLFHKKCLKDWMM